MLPQWWAESMKCWREKSDFVKTATSPFRLFLHITNITSLPDLFSVTSSDQKLIRPLDVTVSESAGTILRDVIFDLKLAVLTPLDWSHTKCVRCPDLLHPKHIGSKWVTIVNSMFQEEGWKFWPKNGLVTFSAPKSGTFSIDESGATNCNTRVTRGLRPVASRNGPGEWNH